MKRKTVFTLLLMCPLLMIACDDIMQSPKMIQADGATYVACKGAVWVSKDGNTLFGGTEVYKVTFTDREGTSHSLRGVKKVTVSDLPQFVYAPMPYNPASLTTDGTRPKEGLTYTWNDGSKAIWKNGNWSPAQILNQACSKPSE